MRKESAVSENSRIEKCGSKRYREYAAQRTGMTRKMKNGLMAEITAYNGSGDITVRFENGKVNKHATYANFLQGSVSYEKTVAGCNKDLAQQRIGEQRVMNNGLKATIVRYICNTRVIIRFEDGTEKETAYQSFVQGYVKYPGNLEDALAKASETKKASEAADEDPAVVEKAASDAKTSDKEEPSSDGKPDINAQAEDVFRKKIAYLCAQVRLQTAFAENAISENCFSAARQAGSNAKDALAEIDKSIERYMRMDPEEKNRK